MDMKELLDRYNDLCEDNDWNVFHTPKNLSAALSVNAAKILEHFQWITEEESFSLARITDRKEIISQELATTFFNILALANKLNIDLESAIINKMDEDSARYQGMPDDEIVDE
ncbi:MAG: nucleotide pyrophosphohydrolase [Candidatus Pelagadaptatus aseana]|uniref:MazG-like family protein n=1 Tax=Candidatus Pelagadaptatus aseana TaxID=3120508 RepID=UPI0039B2A86A